MKKRFFPLLLGVIAAALLVPFASRLPDGLEKVAGANALRGKPVMHGFLNGYVFPGIRNHSVSVILAALAGAALAFAAVAGLALLIKKPRKGDKI